MIDRAEIGEELLNASLGIFALTGYFLDLKVSKIQKIAKTKYKKLLAIKFFLDWKLACHFWNTQNDLLPVPACMKLEYPKHQPLYKNLTLHKNIM